MQTVIHPINHRPWVKDDGPNIGYEGRVVYALGLVKPHCPVPALLTEVALYPTHVAVSVLSNIPGSNHDWHGDGWDVYHYGY